MGVIGDPNQASAYLSYAIPVALFAADEKHVPRGVVFADIVLIIFAIGVMGSRTGLVVAACGCIAYTLFRAAQNGILSIRVIFIIILSLLGVLVVVK